MIIYPAVDIFGGQVVRLEQGKADRKTVYSDDPVAFALKWETEGAQWLHVVDLDGAFTGTPTNLATIGKIAQALKIPVQMGGGMRDAETIAQALALGVKRIVIGTKACDSLDFVRAMVDQHGSDRIAVGIDAKNGKVAVKGWTQASDWDAVQLATAATVAGAGTIIYTDIATDGMFTGPNFPALQDLLEAVDVQVIASGGVASAEHVQKLRTLPNLHGAIVGKALYDGKVTLGEILAK
jgi:phosphoribosylformimino-5-aminoimidazole carboxamide ribotide isomerase